MKNSNLHPLFEQIVNIVKPVTQQELDSITKKTYWINVYQRKHDGFMDFSSSFESEEEALEDFANLSNPDRFKFIKTITVTV